MLFSDIVLKKTSNENLIAYFLALQDNILLQQNDLLQQLGHAEKVIGNNVQNWFAGNEKWRVDKSAYNGTEHLKSPTTGFQYY